MSSIEDQLRVLSLGNDELDRACMLDRRKERSLKTLESAFTRMHVNTVRKQYPCNYCSKKFPTYQALGGHQNAHRHERALAKREKNMSSAAAAFNHRDPVFYPSSARVPMQSMIQKPYDPWHHARLGYGYEGWPRLVNINQQAAFTGWIQPTAGFSSRAPNYSMFGGFGGFQQTNAFTSRAMLGMFGVSSQGSRSRSAANMIAGSNIYCQGENCSEDDETQGLDLSLKL